MGREERERREGGKKRGNKDRKGGRERGRKAGERGWVGRGRREK